MVSGGTGSLGKAGKLVGFAVIQFLKAAGRGSLLKPPPLVDATQSVKYQPGSHAKSAAGSFGASWIGESSRIGIACSHFHSDYGIPESGEDVGVEMTTHRVRAEADWLEPLPGVTVVRFRAAYTDYDHEELANGVAFNKDDVRQPGRSFRVGVRGRF